MRHGWVERSPFWADVIEAFHRYEVRGCLGAGGMAEILLAQAKDPPHQTVVLKRMLPSVAEEPELRAMFVDEARLGMRLTHPSLCRVYDVGTLEGELVIAMEHVDGVTLADLIDRCPDGLPIPVAVSIIARVADALDSVHRARDEHGRLLGIVHRDVTPRNVMIGFDGSVKLLDFGLAKSVLNESKTRPGMAKGKFAYLAPELWTETKPDARADIFSLGVCLFEALTGTRLYHRTSPFDSKAAIVDEPVPSLRDHLPGVPGALDHVVRRCLGKHREQRFESAGALHTALAELLEAWEHRTERESVVELIAERFAEERVRGPQLTPSRFGARAAEPTVRTAHEVRATSLPPAQPRRAALLRASTGRWAALLALPAAALILLAIGLAGGGEPTTDPLVLAGAPPARAPVACLEDEPQIAAGCRSADGPLAIAPPEPIDAASQLARQSVEEAHVLELAPVRMPVDLDRAAPAPRAEGLLSVNTRPWSEVRVDGRAIGTTPLAEVRVPAGTRTLTLVDRDGHEHQLTVEVAADQTTRVFRELSPPVEAPRAQVVPDDPGPG